MRFTTKAYHDEALRLVIDEANAAAKDLRLPEKLPITTTDVKSSFISPFGYAYQNKKIGNITTERYFYGVEQGNKFSNVTITDYDKHCSEYRELYHWPLNKLDLNGALRLATNWLAALHVDMRRLNEESNVKCELSQFWNGLEHREMPLESNCVPIYYVSWIPKNQAQNSNSLAMVELFLPTKTLLQLAVYDQKYILRKPVEFTNLNVLFPGTAPIVTNWLDKMRIGTNAIPTGQF
jgi:hypothetical protein